MADYFVEDPKYNGDIFRHRFRMSKCLFQKIVSDVEANDSWFQEAFDAHGRKGFTSLQKVTSAIKQLATGSTPDENNEYLHMAERTSRSQNDINVLQQSPLFLTKQNRTVPKCPFYVNNHLYKRGYLLVDGIYPTWSVFVKSIPCPHEVDEKKFKRQHGAARKDVEHAFGVLKSKWGVLSRPMRASSVRKIRNVVYTCIILHNMILKDDGNAIAPVQIWDPLVEPALDDTVLDELMDEDTH
ncbi:uncharacterized protein LOC110944368 [Helianthus annuus]|uniref:uncharacterized protein LOC110944368 n=1 Tax=Helianthus annuus TaxID=4232 RepID=UPI00165321C0|nr:uncharacterized protein LOC110944368 [Helianthus annuus]